MKAKVYICNNHIPLYNTYENVIDFDIFSLLDKYEGINVKSKLRGCTINPDTLSVVEVTILYDDVETILKKMTSNYGILEIDSRYYFYFINSSPKRSDTAITFTLELDVWSTIYNDLNFINRHTIIQKAHVDRFIKNIDDTFSYDFSFNSPVQLNEEVEQIFNSRKIDRHYDLVLNFAGYESADYRLAERGWLYFFVQPPKGESIDNNFLLKNTWLKGTQLTRGDNVFMEFPYQVIAVPTFGNHYASVSAFTDSFTGLMNGHELYEMMKLYPSWFSVKFSNKPPYKKVNRQFSYNESEDTFTWASSLSFESGIVNNADEGGVNVLARNFYPVEDKDKGVWIGEFFTGIRSFCIRSIDFDEFYEYYDILLKDNVTFNLDEINNNLEPKLFKKPFYNLNLRTPNDGGFNYDYVKLHVLDGVLKPKLKWLISPDIDREFLYFDTGIYKNASNVSVGSNSSYDSSLPLVGDAFSTWFASHSGTYHTSLNIPLNRAEFEHDQLKTRGFTGIVGGSISSLLGITLGGAFGVSSIARGVNDIIQSSVSLYQGIESNKFKQDQIKETWQANIDDMKNTPDQLKNVTVGVLSNIINENPLNKLIIEKLEFKETQIINDIFHQEGYTINKVMDINLLLKSRVNFNYIRTNDLRGKISSNFNLSNEWLELILAIFRVGTRIWHRLDSFMDFSFNNIETSIIGGN